MSKFQQRHYEAIAEVLQASTEWVDSWGGHKDERLATIKLIENQLVSLFADDNNLFQEHRFRRACVPGANVKARTK